MKLSISLVAIWVALALGQAGTECTREMTETDDCLDVINANACYNKFRFGRNKQTLTCIHGDNDADKAKKVLMLPYDRLFIR